MVAIADNCRLEEMRSASCIRLARQSAALKGSSRSVGPRATLSTAPWGRAPPSFHLESANRQAVRAFSAKPGVHINESSRFAKEEQEEQDEDSVSPFKKHRRKELQEDQRSEDPLYPEAYPRLESSSIRKSVPEFLQESHDELSSELVTLSGRIRSKRVVGSSLIFLDITNEFQKVQIMINKSKVASEQQSRVHKFRLLKNLIQVGDHICRPTMLLSSLCKG